MENQNQEENKLGRFVKLEKVSFAILLGVVFLLPLFVLPFGIFPVDFHKAMLLYIGVSLSALFFILGGMFRGSISVTKSPILVSLLFVLAIWLSSSLFSGNIALSLLGGGYEAGTFMFFLILALIVVLVSSIFRTEEKFTLLYIAIFVSAIILFVLQFLHTALGVTFPPWQIFSNILTSVSGDWVDLGIFSGLISLLAISCLELLEFGKKARIFLWFIIVISLVFVYFVNFSPSQYILGFSVLLFLIYRIACPSFLEIEKNEGSKRFFTPNISFFVFVILLIIVALHKETARLVLDIGLNFSTVSLSWPTTFSVVKDTLSASLLLGSGPNTFFHDLLLFKPDAVLNSPFWDAQFKYGVARVPGMIAETGILGSLALLAFFASFLYAGKNIFTYREHNIKRVLIISSFISAIYLWTHIILYSPGFLIFALASVFTGIFVASVGLIKEDSLLEITFIKNTKRGISLYIIVALVLLGLVYNIYSLSTKYFAGYLYTKAINEASTLNNLRGATDYLTRAIYFDPQDVYLRTVSEAGLLQIGQIFSEIKDVEKVTEEKKKEFRETLTNAVYYAKGAIDADTKNPENWIQLGRVYEAILSLGEKGIKDSAIFVYSEALKVSPRDPSILLSLARVEYQAGDSEKALLYVDDAIKMKGDFTPAHIMRANIKIAGGKTSEGISGLEEAIVVNPKNKENIYLVFYIGTLYYNNGEIEKARDIFEKLVAINPLDVDSRYFLGQSYERMGMTEKAIEQFEEISKLIPNNSQILEKLRNLRFSIQDQDEALSKAVEETPKIEIPKKKK